MRSFALAFVLGALFLQQQPALPDVPWMGVGVALLLLTTLVRRDRVLARVVLLAAAGALGGFGYAAWRAEERLADSLPLALEGRDMELTGVVASLPQVSDTGTRFLFTREAPATVPVTLSLTWYAQEGLPPPTLVAGERWRFTVRLKRPRGLANPHGFDFEAWALERGIRATGYVRPQPAPTLLNARVDGWPFTLHRWRGAVRDAMLAHLGTARLRGVLVALAIGDQDAIAASDWDIFWRTGVGHLMSISGLHITMLGALGFTVAYFLWVRVPTLALRWPARNAAVIAGALTALAYTLMTGYAVPAQRTFVMLATVALLVLASRHGCASRVLAVAALAVVMLDPWAPLSAGFWLSFGAVASIFYVMALRTGRAGKLRAAALEQLAVTVVMLPMLMALFQQVSMVSPLANAFAIPLVSLVVVPLTLAGAFLPLPFLLDAAHALMALLMLPLEALAGLPFAMLESHAPPVWTIAAAVAGCLWLLAPRGVPMRACGWIWILPMFAVPAPRPAPGEAWADVLDVGHGLAVVVRTARHALTYDAGSSWNGDADTGNRIVVPFLRGEGVPRLDGMVVSHADDDHSGGAPSIALERAPRWLLSTLRADDPLMGLGEFPRRCAAGERWEWDGVRFEVLHPGAEVYAEARRRSENDRSCVLRVANTAGSLLLTADVEARAEAEMVRRDAAALASDVLLVPHHGSKSSSSAAFIDAVSPALGLLSVGYRNRFGHPAPAVVARYAERGVALRRTDEDGALRVVLAARGAPQVTGQQAACRYWTARPCAP